MKKVLLIGLILAILLLAFPQGVMAIDKTDPVTVNAAYAGGDLVFTADTVAAKFPWNLAEVGENLGNKNTDALVFTVDSPLIWHIDATDAATVPATEGYMVSTTNPLHSLANYFKIANEGGTMIDLSISKEIENGVPSDNAAFYKTIDQAVVQSDFAMESYSITITFTCANAWVAP